MPVLDHTHTYIRWKIDKSHPKLIQGELVYRCFHPDCSHHEVKSKLLNTRSLCTKCGTEIILDRDALKRVAPMCLKCGNTKKSRALKEAANILDDFHLFDLNEIEEASNKVAMLEEVSKVKEDNAQSE